MNVRSAWTATFWYLAATVALTWPTSAGLARDIPWDLGDSMLVCWLLGWDADHILRFLGGDWGAFRGFWTANIFGREPLTLAYGEHLIALAVQILPVYAVTKNLILCYNVLFLSTFVLSGLGMYLLARDVTGSTRGAFIGGLIYAFALFRIGHYSHLQMLSSQWMPFVLLGLRRYFEHRRPAALAGASIALVAQNLSCGYYLLYFAPFVVAYVLFEIGRRRLWRDRLNWIALGVAATGVAAATLPFLFPYLELRQLGYRPRWLDEVIYFSADVYSYVTAHWVHPLYAERIRVLPKPEGDLFPGLIPPLLAGLGVAAHVLPLLRKTAQSPRACPTWGLRLAITAFSLGSVFIVAIFLTGGLSMAIGPVALRARRVSRPMLVAVVGLTIWAWQSKRVRTLLRGRQQSVIGFYAGSLLACFLLSLGPIPEVMGERMREPGPYMLLYRYVPGFDGLRAPARFGMLFAMFLAVLAAFGVQVLERRVRRAALVIIPLMLLVLFEANAAPIYVNITSDAPGLARPPARLVPGPDAPEIYGVVRSLPTRALLAEFPFGDWAYELRYMYYSTTHWRQLLNGYNGAFPDSYIEAANILRRVPDAGLDDGWEVLNRSGVTHVIVHEGGFVGGQGTRVSAWLRGHGAREIVATGQDRLFELRPAN